MITPQQLRNTMAVRAAAYDLGLSNDLTPYEIQQFHNWGGRTFFHKIVEQAREYTPEIQLEDVFAALWGEDAYEEWLDELYEDDTEGPTLDELLQQYPQGVRI